GRLRRPAILGAHSALLPFSAWRRGAALGRGTEPPRRRKGSGASSDPVARGEPGAHRREPRLVADELERLGGADAADDLELPVEIVRASQLHDGAGGTRAAVGDGVDQALDLALPHR